MSTNDALNSTSEIAEQLLSIKTYLGRLAEDVADLKMDKENLSTSLADKHFENGQLKSYTTFLNEKIYGLNTDLTQANEEKLKIAALNVEQERRLLQQHEEILALRGERDRLANMTAKLLADAEMGRLKERVSVLEKEKNASAIENETRFRAAEEEKQKLEQELQKHRQQQQQQQEQQEEEKKTIVKRNEPTIVSGQDGRYQMCSLETGKCVQKPYGVGGMTAIEIVSDELLATSSPDFSISVWNVTSDELRHRLCGHTGLVVSFALLQLTDILLASGSANGEIRIWSMATGMCVRTMIHYQDERGAWLVFALKALPNRRLASASKCGSLKIWNLDNGECIKEHNAVKRINTSPPGSFFKNRMKTTYQNSPPIFSMAVLTKQSRIAIGLEDDTIQIFGDLQKATLLLVLKGHTGPVYALQTLTDDDEILFSASSDQTIIKWDTRSGARLATFAGHSAHVFSLALVSPNKIASVSFDNTIRLWNVESGECEQTLTKDALFTNRAHERLSTNCLKFGSLKLLSN